MGRYRNKLLGQSLQCRNALTFAGYFEFWSSVELNKSICLDQTSDKFSALCTIVLCTFSA